MSVLLRTPELQLMKYVTLMEIEIEKPEKGTA
jgi:hypothetical protein